MNEMEKRDAVLREFTFTNDAGVHRVWRVADMAAEILRLRDDNTSLRAAVERVLALHVCVQTKNSPAWCENCDRAHPCATLIELEETP